MASEQILRAIKGNVEAALLGLDAGDRPRVRVHLYKIFDWIDQARLQPIIEMIHNVTDRLTDAQDLALAKAIADFYASK